MDYKLTIDFIIKYLWPVPTGYTPVKIYLNYISKNHFNDVKAYLN